MAIGIPDGHELLAGRSRDNARQALAMAEERGFPASSVHTHPEGYLIPLGADAEVVEIEGVTEKNTVAEIDDFAAEWSIDLGDAKTKAEKVAVIDAEIERRTAEQESAGSDENEED